MSIKLAKDTITQDHLNQLADWLRAAPDRLTQGPVVAQYESMFAQKLGTKYAVMVNSGSSALLLMLAALIERGICKFNKQVVVPALSWATDVSSITLLGLQPVFVDCNMKDLSVDLNKLEYIFKKESPSALLLVSILGLVPDMDKIQELCTKYKVVLIEDVCESYGSKYNGQNLGTFGTMSAFSSYYGHTYSSIEGGVVATDSEYYYNLLVMLRSHGWNRDCTESKKKELRDEYNFSEFESLYKFFVPAFNVRSTELNAFLGLLQLDVVDEYIRIRNENFNHWISAMKGYTWTPTPNESDYVSSFALPVLVANRDLLVKECKKRGTEVRPLVAGDMTQQPFVYKKYPIPRGMFPNANYINKYGAYLPNHQSVSSKDVEELIDTVLSVI